MSHDSRGNEPDQVNNGALAVILGIVALATFAVALVVTALVRDEVRELSGVRDVSQDREYRDLKAGQLGKLEASPGWVDKAQGVVSLPISRAMALTLEEVRANPAKLSPWFVNVAPVEAAPADASAEAVEPVAGVEPAVVPAATEPAAAAVAPKAPSTAAAGTATVPVTTPAPVVKAPAPVTAPAPVVKAPAPAPAAKASAPVTAPAPAPVTAPAPAAPKTAAPAP